MKPIKEFAVIAGDVTRALINLGYAGIAILFGSPNRLDTKKSVDLKTGTVKWHTTVNDPREMINLDTTFIDE